MSCAVLLCLLSLVSSGLCASTTSYSSMELVADGIFLVLMAGLGGILGWICSKHLEYLSLRIEEMKEAKRIRNEFEEMTEFVEEDNNSEEEVENEWADQIEEENQIEEKNQMEEAGDTPKDGDRQLLFFVSGIESMLIAMSQFLQNRAAYINKLDNIYGIDREIEYFHKYMVRLSNRDLNYFWDILKEEDFSKADWQWSMEFDEDFKYDGLGFADGVEKIMEVVEKYCEDWKEYVDNATDKKIVELNIMMMQFVKNGCDFLKIVKENDEIAADYDIVPMA